MQRGVKIGWVSLLAIFVTLFFGSAHAAVGKMGPSLIPNEAQESQVEAAPHGQDTRWMPAEDSMERQPMPIRKREVASDPGGTQPADDGVSPFLAYNQDQVLMEMDLAVSLYVEP